MYEIDHYHHCAGADDKAIVTEFLNRDQCYPGTGSCDVSAIAASTEEWADINLDSLENLVCDYGYTLRDNNGKVIA